jgi:prevent-host-death family protein
LREGGARQSDGAELTKPITMTEFRKEPGEYVRDVARNRRSFLITKAGKPVAKLVPVDDVLVIESDGSIPSGEVPLTALLSKRARR